MVFERLDAFNEEIEELARPTVLRRPRLRRGARRKYTGVATQHRIYGVAAQLPERPVERAHKIPFNPVYAVELEPRRGPPRSCGIPAQVARFLDSTADDRLALLWRLVLLRGFRRGEICALADD